MGLSRIFATQLSPRVRPTALAAARDAFPDATLVEINSLAEAAQHRAIDFPELLLLGEPDAAQVAAAIGATDCNGLPRWAVIVLGRVVTEGAETIFPEEWNPALLAHTFRSVLLQHELTYENLRFRGDLRTIARRVRHDLNSPVGCIYTSSNVLELTPHDGATVAAMIENIRESSREISQIIDRISFVLVASTEPRSRSHVAMEEVIAAALRPLDAELRQKKGMVDRPEFWPEVRGVPAWLHVIWSNLLTNAIRHGGPEPRIVLTWAPDDDGYRFSVVDRGPGVAPAVRASLFRPLDQLHLQPVHGLGLAIVHRLVTLQGGHCGFQRHDNGTSEFFFSLPAGTPPLDPSPVANSSAGNAIP